ncbi:MAG: hypothetical protein AB7R89_15670 [Dehalococcoidia bacterium]
MQGEPRGRVATYIATIAGGLGAIGLVIAGFLSHSPIAVVLALTYLLVQTLPLLISLQWGAPFVVVAAGVSAMLSVPFLPSFGMLFLPATLLWTAAAWLKYKAME